MRGRLALLACLLPCLVGCIGRPGPDATGREIYEQVCARCHGASMTGRVGPALGPGSDAADQPDEFLVQTITNGRGRMPSFSSTLSDQQIARVIAYMRQVQEGE
ncbi:MAG: cytochrome c [Acidimicrobiia bacterium]